MSMRNVFIYLIFVLGLAACSSPDEPATQTDSAEQATAPAEAAPEEAAADAEEASDC